LWFARAGRRTELAKAVCAGCLVRDECLGFALAEGIEDGVWAGLSPQERRVRRRTAA
jgi:WhiB family redox-sensing transcriptional regulator